MTRVAQGRFHARAAPAAARLSSARPGAQRPSVAAASAAPVVAMPRRAGVESFAVDPSVLRKVGPGEALPDELRAQMEQAFGTGFADVRVHVGPQAGSIGALAFTVGSDLYFAPGQYTPATERGRQLIGHELAHVVQQRQGRVMTPAGDGLVVVHDPVLEAEAERRGQMAARPSPRPPAPGPVLVPAAPASAARPGVLLPKGPKPKRNWTDAQRDQSRKFWEKKERKAEARRLREAYIASPEFQEKLLLKKQRIQLHEVVEADEVYFEKYMAIPKSSVLVYRGDGRDVTEENMLDFNLKPLFPEGGRDISFRGIVGHVTTNTMKNGMISTTADKACAIHFAVSKHKFGRVYTMEVRKWIDVEEVLRARNFKNRFEGQREYVVYEPILTAHYVSVEVYKQNPAKDTELWSGGDLLHTETRPFTLKRLAAAAVPRIDTD
ncbi:MAG: DUF4157 domain-containing protein [Alphaproteobacteria bacterium]